MTHRSGIILTVLACLLFGFSPAWASSIHANRARVHDRVGLAGYHFATSKASLLVRGRITVPKSTCGKDTYRYAPQIGAGFVSGSLHEDAIVVLHLKCRAGHQRPGTAEVVAGFHVKRPAALITAGQTIRVRLTVRGGWSSAEIIYPSGKSVKVWGSGGSPSSVAYALVLPRSAPPHYSPLKFTACYVNSKRLSAFNPRIWQSVTSAGVVDGKVSSLSGNGTSFTISY
jgi:hypothetical protein